MSIISDALKKVEGTSAAVPTGAAEAPAASGAVTERPQEDLVPRSPPPLLSVWSIVLSTIMVLIATALLLLTWRTNRASSRDVAESPVAVADEPPETAAPPAVVAEPEAAVVAEPVPTTATVAAAPTPADDEVEAPVTGSGPAKRDELDLTGVVFTSQMRVAHINGKILSEGGEIAGYRIVRISRESVRLSKDGNYYVLQLKH